MRAMNHLAAKDFTIIMKGYDQGAAEPAERSVEVGLRIFGMVLFCKHEVHAWLITEWLAPTCRYIRQLRLFAVAFEDACHGRFHVCGGPKLFNCRCRERIARL